MAYWQRGGSKLDKRKTIERKETPIQLTGGIDVRLPEKIFVSQYPDIYLVKSDFSITITGELPALKKESMRTRTGVGKGEEYPTIYMKGFEQLFDAEDDRNDRVAAFCNLFHVNGDKDWEIGYGICPDTGKGCMVITTTKDFLEPDFSVTFQLSDKCVFTNRFVPGDIIKLDVCICHFDELLCGVEERIEYTRSLAWEYTAYIERFGAYVSGSENPVTVVHKGGDCDISWRICQNAKASTFLYDENGAVVANLPPYHVKIDRERKFTLLAYNNACAVQQSVVVYRTLWDKAKAVPTGLPGTDEKGRFKIYQDNGEQYYLYIHPTLYVSDDCVTWEAYAENTAAASGYTFYSSTLSEDKFCVCYLDDSKLTYCEMDWDSKTWSGKGIARNALAAYALLSDPGNPRIVLVFQDVLAVYELKGGALMNGQYMNVPADALADGKRSYLAFSCSNNKVYFYDLDDDFRDNIFECPETPDDNLWLVKSNAVYIVLNGYAFEVCDREKFMDVHYFPGFMKRTRPAIGGVDGEEIRGFFWTEEGTESWHYKF